MTLRIPIDILKKRRGARWDRMPRVVLNIRDEAPGEALLTFPGALGECARGVTIALPRSPDGCGWRLDEQDITSAFEALMHGECIEEDAE